MIYTNVPGKVVMARVITDFRPDYTGWQAKAPQWIADALERLSVYPTTSDAEPKTVTVEEHKFQLPCDLRVLRAIEYNGARVERKAGIHAVNSVTDSQTTLDLTIDSITAGSLDTYYEVLNDGWCYFSVSDCDIIIHYKTVPIDLDNDLKVFIPRVPDDTKVISAIAWYILMMMLQTGYKHPLFDLNSKNEITNPYVRWEKERVAAMNSVGKMDADERNMVSQMFREFLTNPYVHYYDAFKDR